MELLFIFVLLFAGVVMLVYQLSRKKLFGEVHLPQEIKGQTEEKGFDLANY